MAKIINKYGMSEEFMQRINDFLVPFNTKDLTIVFVKDWEYNNNVNHSNVARENIKNHVNGSFLHNSNKYNGIEQGHYGLKSYKRPIIVINCPAIKTRKLVFLKMVSFDDYVYWVFLHEFGHYYDYTINQINNRYKSGAEIFADKFADLHYTGKTGLVSTYKKQLLQRFIFVFIGIIYILFLADILLI